MFINKKEKIMKFITTLLLETLSKLMKLKHNFKMLVQNIKNSDFFDPHRWLLYNLLFWVFDIPLLRATKILKFFNFLKKIRNFLLYNASFILLCICIPKFAFWVFFIFISTFYVGCMGVFLLSTLIFCLTSFYIFTFIFLNKIFRERK